MDGPQKILEQFPILAGRRQHSQTVLTALREKLSEVEELGRVPGLCIYATGSYARGEASKYSDLDVFFVDHEESSRRTSVTIVFAELIRASRALNLPEFSGDGRYLDVHKLPHMMDELGSPEDDYRNYFTARLLLLLESAPITHTNVYQRILSNVIESYYRDYHDHNEQFRPMFLANDILRFWKTLCLNYEHKRNRQGTDPEKLGDKKLKSHLKNLKLKFSRMTTCFSAVAAVAKQGRTLDPSQLLEIVQASPLERISTVAAEINGGREICRKMMEEYSWFLEQTGRTEAEVLKWIDDRTNRDEAFARAREYGGHMFDLLRHASDENTLRYLVI